MKRICIFVLSVLIVLLFSTCLTLSVGATQDATVQYGDVNLEGSIEITDATRIQRALASIDTLNPISIEAADYDHDGYMTILDATMIQRKLAGLYLPTSYGGEFWSYSSGVNFYADYCSGKAMIGFPVTFTAEGGYSPYATVEFYEPKYRFIVYKEPDVGTGDLIILFESEWSENQEFIYTFSQEGDYLISVFIKDRFENESWYHCSYHVISPYSIEKPVITSVYGDKATSKKTLSFDTIIPSKHWENLTIYTLAVGGTENYEYRYELCKGKDRVIQDYSSDNSFLISKNDLPKGGEEWESITPYTITIFVKDSIGDITSATVQLTAPYDFEYAG